MVAEQRAQRIARVYATLSMAYEAIVRIRERLPLFEQVCRVLVEQGGLRMVWVGEVDDHGWIVPVAHAGVTDGYLDDLRISVRDVPEGRGPTGTAVRERQHVFITDVATDERMTPWHDAALAREYRSSAAFPLVIEDRCVAVLTAYSPEPGFFDEEEVRLFDRMSADVSFALEAMQRDERRRALEAELRASEKRFRAAAESMLDALAIVSPVRDPGGEIIDFRHEYVNDAYCALVGFDQEQLLDHRLGELFPQFPGSDRFTVYRGVAETSEPCRSEAVHGEGAWAGTPLATRVIDTVIAPLGENLVVSARDVTERKRAEEQLAHTAGVLERTQEISETGGWEYDLATGNLTWTDEVYRIYGRERTSDPLEVANAITAYDPDSAPIIEAAFARLDCRGRALRSRARLSPGRRGADLGANNRPAGDRERSPCARERRDRGHHRAQALRAGARTGAGGAAGSGADRAAGIVALGSGHRDAIVVGRDVRGLWSRSSRRTDRHRGVLRLGAPG